MQRLKRSAASIAVRSILAPAAAAALLVALPRFCAFAQPAPTSTTQPAPQAVAAVAADDAATTEIRIPTTRRASTTQITMNFQDAPVDTVLDRLSELAGLIIVKEIKAEGRVTMVVKGEAKISPDEVISVLNTVGKNSNFAIVRMGKIVKVMDRQKALKSTPIQTIKDPAKIEPTDDPITVIIPVDTVDAVKLKQDLALILSSDAQVTANGGSNTLIITDTQAGVRRAVELVAAIDKRDSADSGMLVKTLKYADAAAAAKLITDVFKPEDQQGGGGGRGNLPGGLQFLQRFGRGGGGGGGGPGAFFGGPGGGGGGGGGAGGSEGGESTRSGKITASSDQRTNTIVVTGPKAILNVIEEQILKVLDEQPISEQTFFIYALKNAQASNLQTVLNNLFGSGNGSGLGGTNRTGTTGNRTGTNTGFGNTGGNRGGGGGFGGGGFGGGGGGFGGGGGGFGGGGGGFGGTASRGGGTGQGSRTGTGASGGINRTGTTAGRTGTGFGGQNTASELVGQVYVVADPDTNSLLVATATKLQDKVREVIEQLDRAVPQVLIKVLIAEVSHDNSQDLGVDFSILNQRSGTDSLGNTTTFGTKAGTGFGTAQATGGLVVNLVEHNVNVTLRALAQAGKLDVLSRPYILASDNQAASITVGQEVPFVTQSRTDALGNLINTVQYQDIGIILNVTPHINPDGLVILDVAPEISQLTDSTVTISENLKAPIYNKRSADTRVGINNGQTIVIGGLMEDRKSSTLQKVPILGDIPLIGTAFQRNTTSKTKTELLIFLTPHVAQQPDTLKPMSEDELKGTKLTPNAVEPGTFDEHLKGLKRGGADSRTSDQQQTKP